MCCVVYSRSWTAKTQYENKKLGFITTTQWIPHYRKCLCIFFHASLSRVLICGSPCKYIFSSGRRNKHEFVRQQVQHCRPSFVSGHPLLMRAAPWLSMLLMRKGLPVIRCQDSFTLKRMGRALWRHGAPLCCMSVQKSLPPGRRSILAFTEFHTWLPIGGLN